MTIQIYGKTYAPNGRKAVQSLFDPRGTVNGLYKVTKAGIRFYSLSGELRAFIRRDGFGPVSATVRDDGRAWYMFGLTNSDAEWMSAPPSFTDCQNGARDLAKAIFPRGPA